MDEISSTPGTAMKRVKEQKIIDEYKRRSDWLLHLAQIYSELRFLIFPNKGIWFNRCEVDRYLQDSLDKDCISFELLT